MAIAASEQARPMAVETRRVIIDAQVGDGQITGSARHESGEPRQFSGWLELLAALDGLLDGPTLSEIRITRDGES